MDDDRHEFHLNLFSDREARQDVDLAHCSPPMYHHRYCTIIIEAPSAVITVTTGLQQHCGVSVSSHGESGLQSVEGVGLWVSAPRSIEVYY